MSVSDGTIKANTYGQLFENEGKDSSEKAKQLDQNKIKNPGRTPNFGEKSEA